MTTQQGISSQNIKFSTTLEILVQTPPKDQGDLKERWKTLKLGKGAMLSRQVSVPQPTCYELFWYEFSGKQKITVQNLLEVTNNSQAVWHRVTDSFLEVY